MRVSGSRRGGILSGLLMTGAALMAIAVICGIYIARNVHVMTSERRGGGDVSIETPGGSFRIRAHQDMDPAAIGTPVYPGARRRKDGGGASFEWNSADGAHDKSVSVAGAEMITNDSAEDVLKWYQKQSPNWIVKTERHGQTHLELREGGVKRIVVIEAKGDGTHIGLASVGDAASN